VIQEETTKPNGERAVREEGRKTDTREGMGARDVIMPTYLRPAILEFSASDAGRQPHQHNHHTT